MIDILRHRAPRMALLVQVLAIAILASLGSGNAWAVKIDPVWAARQTGLQSPAEHRVAARTHDIHPAALNRPGRPKSRDILPVPTAAAPQVQGIQITPTSASWKVNGLRPQLVKLLIRVQLHFGRPLHIVSGCRSKKHNRLVGGARRSQHLHCKAVDFEIPGVSKRKLAAYLKQLPGRGGVGVYCRSSYVHLDIGPKRQWYWSCGKRKKYKKRRTRRKVARLSKKYKNRRALRKHAKKRNNRKIPVAKKD